MKANFAASVATARSRAKENEQRAARALEEKKKRDKLEAYVAFAADGLKFSESVVEERWPNLSRTKAEDLFKPPPAFQRFRKEEERRKQIEKDKAHQRLLSLGLPPRVLLPALTRSRSTPKLNESPESHSTKARTRKTTPMKDVTLKFIDEASSQKTPRQSRKSYSLQTLSGAKPVHGKADTQSIALDNGLQYNKQLQGVVPLAAQAALDPLGRIMNVDLVGPERKKRVKKCEASNAKPGSQTALTEATTDLQAWWATEAHAAEGSVQALRRWVDFPAPIPDATADQLQPIPPPAPPAPHTTGYAVVDGHLSDLEERQYVTPSPGAAARTYNQELFRKMLQEWCASWKIAIHPDPEAYDLADVERDMRNGRNQFTQCGAVALCAWPGAICCSDKDKLHPANRVTPAPDGEWHGSTDALSRHEKLPESLRLRLQEMFVAPNTGAYVRIAVLLVLCALDMMPEPELCEPVLNEMMEDVGFQHRWTGAQCASVISSEPTTITKVFHELFAVLQDTDRERKERAMDLLTALSHRTKLIRLLACDILNSRSSKERLAVCELLPRLSEKPTQDMANKLAYLHWHDDSHEVRECAAVALIKTGNAKILHDEIWSALLNGDEEEKASALEKMATYRLLTKRLTPLFLAAFQSPFMSVRLSAVNVVGVLNVTEETIVRKVMNQLVDGPTSLKLASYKALCMLNPPPSFPELSRHMEWAVQLEPDPRVKAQACAASSKLSPRHPPVVAQLKSLLESDETVSVKQSAEAALVAMGEEPIPERREMQQISKQLDELTSRDRVLMDIYRADRRDKAVKEMTTKLKKMKAGEE